MHVFQDLDIKDTEFNPFWLLGQDWAALVSENDGKINASAASWGGFGVMWERNVAMISIPDSGYTKELLDQGAYFSLCFFSNSQPKFKAAMKYLKIASGRNEDKIKAADLTIGHRDGIPYIDEASFLILCRTLGSFPLSASGVRVPLIREQFCGEGEERTLFVGEIKGIYAR